MKNKAEANIIAFLNSWKSNNFTGMYELTQQTWKFKHSKKQLKKLLTIKGNKPSRLKSFKVTEIREFMPTVYDANIVLMIGGNRKKVTARLVCETEPYKPSVDGEFGVNPISLIKNLY